MKRLRLLLILMVGVALFSCSKNKDATLFDAVPLNAELILETSDSAVMVMFDTLLYAHVNKEGVAEGSPMALVCVPVDGHDEFVLIVKPPKGRMKVYGENTVAVEAVNEQIRNAKKLTEDDGFSKLQNTLGQNVKAHLFYKDPRGWAALDVRPDGNNLVLSGYAMAGDLTSSLLPLRDETPVENTVVTVLPYNTKMMLHYGMSDYVTYWKSFCDEEREKTFNKKYGTDVESKLLPYLSEVSYNIVGDARHEVFVARINKYDAVNGFMNGFKVVDTRNYRDKSLRDLGKCDFLPAVFGKDFENMNRCCYVIVDPYLLIASDFSTLEGIIDNRGNGRTLDQSENHRDFQQNMLDRGNITIYEAGKGNQTKVDALVGGPLSRFLKAHPKFLDESQAFSIQLKSSRDKVYTYVSLSRTAVTKHDEENVRWRANLDAPLQGRPYIVNDHTTQTKNVVAFDCDNKMYLIDNNGNILWTKQLDEAPLSEVFMVDCYGNGKVQYLFNTPHSIQLIDRKGNNVEGYPVKLPFEASNGMALCDYNGYRILLCSTDGRVFNYTIQGIEVDGWNKTYRSEHPVKQPVVYLKVDTKDYLVVSDVDGCVSVLDRKGNNRIHLSTDMKKSPKSDLYVNLTNRSKGIFLTTDKSGKLLYVTEKGSSNTTDFGTFSEEHFFLYEDFDGNQDPDFIYLDKNTLHVFDRTKKELFTHQFNTDIETKPIFYNIGRNKRLLGVVSEKAREISLIDNKGKMIVGSGLAGETPFAVGSLNSNQEINLVTGVGSTLVNYYVSY